MVNAPDSRSNGLPPGFDEGPFEPTEAFSWALGVLRSEPQRIGLPLVLAAFAQVVIATLVERLLVGLVSLLGGMGTATFVVGLLGILSRLFGAGVLLVVSAYVCVRVYPFVLDIARGKSTRFSSGPLNRPLFVRVLVLLAVVWVATAIGSLVCVLPGVFIVVSTGLSVPLLIDFDLSVAAALRGSIELTKPYWLSLFVFYFLSFIAVLAGLLLCFIGAVLFSIPLVFLAHAYVYLRLQGETPVSV
ncbi:MAG: hypothetical protein QM784_34680 [Polyangiaceae bacterium]